MKSTILFLITILFSSSVLLGQRSINSNITKYHNVNNDFENSFRELNKLHNTSDQFTYTLENEITQLGLAVSHVKIADVDYDNKNELIVGSNHYLEIGKYFNNEYQIIWSKNYPQQNFVPCFAIGDIDNDNQNEIILASANEPVEDDTLRVLKYNSQTSNFDQIAWTAMGRNVGSWSLAIADMDNDSKNEIIVYNRYFFTQVNVGIKIYNFENQQLNLEWASADKFGYGRYSVAVGDIDNDGYLDLVTDSGSPTDLLYIFGYNGSNYELKYTKDIDTGDNRFSIGDIDHDGVEEIIVGHSGTDLRIFSFHEGELIEESNIQLSRNRNDELAIGDLTNDGKLEFASTRYGEPTVKIFKSCVANSYNLIGTVPYAYSGYGVAIGDCDNDGQNELYCGQKIYSVSYEYTAVNENSSHSPSNYYLSQNYPNPFNSETIIQFSLPRSEIVTITIYDLLGRKVITLVNENLPAGMHQVKWNGTNSKGIAVVSGIYILRLEAGSFKNAIKISYLK